MTTSGQVVFDASAVLALFLKESRARFLTREILERSVVSTVNLAEVHSKLVRDGYDSQMAWEDSLALVSSVELYTEAHARIAGDLIPMTRPYGLSLGDRSCLALAVALGAPVYTTESLWPSLNLSIPIHVIR